MKNPRDVFIGTVLIAFSALIYQMTLGLPAGSASGGLAPSSFPRALAIFIGALSVILVVAGIFRKPDGEQEKMLGPLFRQMVAFFCIMVVYILLMPQIGYIVSTLVFLTASVLLIMPQRKPRDLAIGILFVVVSSLAVYYIFGIFLNVPLIEGPVDEVLRQNVFGLLGGK
ncbi:MAG TPA: tripartite tricarboxylate transporter TctB family protein [bacterium]|nr:tripartite tricarboxylate transporter TctB family protein [bacterium]